LGNGAKYHTLRLFRQALRASVLILHPPTLQSQIDSYLAGPGSMSYDWALENIRLRLGGA